MPWGQCSQGRCRDAPWHHSQPVKASTRTNVSVSPSHSPGTPKTSCTARNRAACYGTQKTEGTASTVRCTALSLAQNRGTSAARVKQPRAARAPPPLRPRSEGQRGAQPAAGGPALAGRGDSERLGTERRQRGRRVPPFNG